MKIARFFNLYIQGVHEVSLQFQAYIININDQIHAWNVVQSEVYF